MLQGQAFIFREWIVASDAVGFAGKKQLPP